MILTLSLTINITMYVWVSVCFVVNISLIQHYGEKIPLFTFAYISRTNSLITYAEHLHSSQNRIRTEHNMCVVVAVVCTEFNQPEPIVCSHIFAKENENLFERVHGEPRSRLCLDIRFFLHILNFILMLMCNTLCF